MNCFYFSRYRFYKANAKKELKFFLLSDIHFSPKVTQSTLNSVRKQAKLLAPNYILIAGDLVDSLDAVQDKSDLKRLTSWLEQLGQIAPALIALGNHDFYRKNPAHTNIFSDKRHWYAKEPTELINAINELDNVKVLNNETYEDKSVYIFGFTQTPEYFQFYRDAHHTTSIFNPGSEDKNIMLYDLRHLDHNLIEK